MLIQCPQCKTQAQLPESHKGSKVRCSECERIYVATPLGSTRSITKNNSLPIYLAVGGGLLLIGILVATMGSSPPPKKKPIVVEEKVVEAKEPVDFMGWKSAPVRAVRELHRAALATDDTKLRSMLDGPRIWERIQTEYAEADAKQAEDPATRVNEASVRVPLDYVSKHDARGWSDLGQDEQSAFMSEIIESMTNGEDIDLIANWRPYDGSVVDESDDICKVEVAVNHSTDTESTEGRTIHWQLAKHGEHWRAFSWERFYTQAEIAELVRQRARKTKKKTLSDGSEVFEGEPGPIAHYDDTPQSVRNEIDTLLATMLDLELPGPKTAAASRQLANIGRPAIPALLTMLYNTPLESEDQAIQLNMINETLTDITGHQTTYNPLRLLSTEGVTADELNHSGIKQWFGWYQRKGKSFKKKIEEDLIDSTLTPRDANERRDYERALKDLERQNN